MSDNKDLYTGPSIIENYAVLLNNNPIKSKNEEKLIKKYIGFSLLEMTFYIKNSHTDRDYLESFTGKAIINFHDKLSENEFVNHPNGNDFLFWQDPKNLLFFLKRKICFRNGLDCLISFFTVLILKMRSAGN